MDTRLNTRKKVIQNQNYEDYWKSTLALTDFYGAQFIRTLQVIIEHIDKYQLDSLKPSDLIKNLNASRKQFTTIAHYQELQDTVKILFPNDDKSGATTRKQLNTFVKLGFIKPYLNGYVPAAKQYIKPNQTREELSRLFSDTVYQYSSFNSSMTTDDSQTNQIKFLVNTLLNKSDKKLEMDELLGVMQMNVTVANYATDKKILQDKNWAKHINFFERKYNQVGHLKAILSNLNLFEVIKRENKQFMICLAENSNEFLPDKGDTTRDTYRFALMKKAVFEESNRVYGKKVSWFSKEEQEGLVVSHIYASAEALSNRQIDAAYDPNNALLLKPGDEDQYFDKYKMTFDNEGVPIFSNEVRLDFISSSRKKGYKIDKPILTSERISYLEKYHTLRFPEYKD
ncbi:hypothetical protein VNN28_03265 [Lactococcus formosensis]|uniref:hypothetical protein n=1 Tax=Lactococcus formosensis TaxID=1281486 RepID=UPI0030D11095